MNTAKSTHVDVRLDKEMLGYVCRIAREREVSRSEVIRDAVRLQMAQDSVIAQLRASAHDGPITVELRGGELVVTEAP